MKIHSLCTTAVLACLVNISNLSAQVVSDGQDVPELVKMLSKIDGVDDMAMTTNAFLLPKFAEPLKDAVHILEQYRYCGDWSLYSRLLQSGDIA